MDFAALPIPILYNRSKILSQMTSNCTSGRSIFLCQAISKCSLVETAFLLLVTVSTVKSRHSNIFPGIIWWSSDPFSCRVCLRFYQLFYNHWRDQDFHQNRNVSYRKLNFPKLRLFSHTKFSKSQFSETDTKTFSPNTTVSETETQTLKNDSSRDRLSSFIFDNFWMGTQPKGDLPILNDLIGQFWRQLLSRHHHEPVNTVSTT